MIGVCPINKGAFGIPGALTFPREELRLSEESVHRAFSKEQEKMDHFFLAINGLEGKQVLQVLIKITLKVSSPCSGV